MAGVRFLPAGGCPVIGEIRVSEGMREIRPYVGGFGAEGLAIDEETLAQLIQTQEKISEIFGRNRKRISIGIYNLRKITFPVDYKAVDPNGVRFVPLGAEEAMTPAEILKAHPKGIAYAGILDGLKRVPLLTDAEERVLSFPPIINSREVGEVKAGDRDLFVEVTGVDLRLVLLILNVFAANLADRGGVIRPAKVVYPYPTEMGFQVSVPIDFGRPVEISVREIRKALGEDVDLSEIIRLLDIYGHWVRKRKEGVEVTPPPYRDDVMHPVDVIEDVAVSRGYGTFDPVLPTAMTVGELSEIETLSDRVRESFVGMGFQEVISNILTSKTDVTVRMNRPDAPVVEVDNVMSESYSVLRPGLLPSLLEVEGASGKSFYPHRIFEAGEAAEPDPEALSGSRTSVKAAALTAHAAASFSEVQSHLDVLMYYLAVPYQLVPVEHPSFIPGRVGEIRVAGKPVGVIGEIHPGVLEGWEIDVPCAALELDLGALKDRMV
ncbi:MAG: phenylalanine--tRNA ligase subunit beta [Nitrospirae bacterium]|nr:phenylalanine--tRNA ligase subunit beta [Nitrospirota bacterium]